MPLEALQLKVEIDSGENMKCMVDSDCDQASNGRLARSERYASNPRPDVNLYKERTSLLPNMHDSYAGGDLIILSGDRYLECSHIDRKTWLPWLSTRRRLKRWDELLDNHEVFICRFWLAIGLWTWRLLLGAQRLVPHSLENHLQTLFTKTLMGNIYSRMASMDQRHSDRFRNMIVISQTFF